MGWLRFRGFSKPIPTMTLIWEYPSSNNFQPIFFIFHSLYNFSVFEKDETAGPATTPPPATGKSFPNIQITLEQCYIYGVATCHYIASMSSRRYDVLALCV